MFKHSTTHEVDMCNGPLFSKIVVFFIPVMLSNILQLLYNAADQLIVGRFAGSRYLAAVGATGSLINLIICLLMGLSVGTTSVVSRYFGAGNQKSLYRSVHTSMAVSLVCGVVLGLLGYLFCKPLLRLMETPDNVIDLATLYMKIYFAGLPAVAVYNFGSAILRAVGDTKRPMLFLILSGMINIILNLVLVIYFRLNVAGVAIATVISQLISAVLIIICLVRTRESYQLIIKQIRFYKNELLQMIHVGIPAGIQGASFSLSNVFIQSAINTFGENAMAGCTAAANIDNLIYQALNSLYHTVLTFSSQNFGAGKKDRIVKSILYCSSIVIVLGLIIGGVCYVLSPVFLSFFLDNAEAAAFGMERLKLTCLTYFTCGLMEVGAGALRGINKSVISMVGSIVGACLLRIVWIYTIFAADPTIYTLFLSYPATWIITALFHYSMLALFLRKIPQRRLA